MELQVRQPPGEADIGFVRKTILLVEDEVFIRWALSDGLSQAGFIVLQAFNAGEALSVLQSSMPIDLLITDIRMPGPMDGIALATFARANWPQLKIMFISGNLADLPADAPADAIVEKPYIEETVIATVQQLLAQLDRASTH
jgi:two-component system, response regulator PdtaR